jgi:GTP-binding protein
MVIKDLQLETVVGVTGKLPVNTLPEIAFAGRSNVGKSSLINGLLGRKSFARTSSQPGKTQTLNFYKVNNELYFTDLPGYGYARVSMTLRQKWGKVIEKYLKTSKQLRCIIQLVDIRHEPTKDDVAMFEWINAMGLKTFVVATKADKISRGAVKQQCDMIRKCLKAKADVKIIPFSSVTKQGAEDIWKEITESLAAEAAE